MKLTSLNIVIIERWERENPGQYKATVTYEGESGSTTLILDPEVSTNLLGYLGPVITEFSRRTSIILEKQIQQAIAESRKLPAIEAVSETVQ